MEQKEKKYITLQAVDLIAFIMEVYKQLIDDVCHWTFAKNRIRDRDRKYKVYNYIMRKYWLFPKV